MAVVSLESPNLPRASVAMKRLVDRMVGESSDREGDNSGVVKHMSVGKGAERRDVLRRRIGPVLDEADGRFSVCSSERSARSQG